MVMWPTTEKLIEENVISCDLTIVYITQIFHISHRLDNRTPLPVKIKLNATRYCKTKPGAHMFIVQYLTDLFLIFEDITNKEWGCISRTLRTLRTPVPCGSQQIFSQATDQDKSKGLRNIEFLKTRN
jgi:hypothetical protein